MPKATRTLSEIRLSRLTTDATLRAVFERIERDDPTAQADVDRTPQGPAPVAARELVEA